MARATSKQLVSNLYGLLLDINLHRADEQILEELEKSLDPTIHGHMLKIKQLQRRYEAEANKKKFKEGFAQLMAMKQKGMDEIRKLIRPQDEAQLIPLFRKFETLTSEDEMALLDDQELLILLERLNSKINDKP
jgi:hypothetical protein